MRAHVRERERGVSDALALAASFVPSPCGSQASPASSGLSQRQADPYAGASPPSSMSLGTINGVCTCVRMYPFMQALDACLVVYLGLPLQ